VARTVVLRFSESANQAKAATGLSRGLAAILHIHFLEKPGLTPDMWRIG
jgi:hypothetical protein